MLLLPLAIATAVFAAVPSSGENSLTEEEAIEAFADEHGALFVSCSRAVDDPFIAAMLDDVDPTEIQEGVSLEHLYFCYGLVFMTDELVFGSVYRRGGEITFESERYVKVDDEAALDVAATEAVVETTEPAFVDEADTDVVVIETTEAAESSGNAAAGALASAEGSGSRAVELSTPIAELAVVDIVAEGDGLSDFEIRGLDANLAETNVFVWDVPVDGQVHRVLFDSTAGAPVRYLQITSDTAWNVTILPIDIVADWSGDSALSGTASNIVRYDGPAGLVDFSFTEGETWSVFSVIARSTDGGILNAVVAGELETVEGTSTIPAGPLLLEIGGSGAWELSAVRPPG